MNISIGSAYRRRMNNNDRYRRERSVSLQTARTSDPPEDERFLSTRTRNERIDVIDFNISKLTSDIRGRGEGAVGAGWVRN